jgi:parallel beta-helix repeat protein
MPAQHSAILSDQDNVVIKNLKIKDFCDGIGLYRTDNNTVTGCSISNCGKNGVSTHGIHMVGTNNCTITKNEIFKTIGTGDSCGDGGNGIFMHGLIGAGGDWNNITHNNLSYNNKSGFFMKYTPMHNIISNNIATGNGEGGIVPMCKKSNYNIIERNNVSGNTYYGIYIGGKNNTIRYNTVNNNGYFGINLDRSDGSYNNELYENTACGNIYADIRTCGPECYGNHGSNNTCNTTSHYNDTGTTGCTYPCGPAPDLAIIEKSEEWVDLAEKTYNITYTIKNIGDADASESDTSIKIDRTEVATDPVPALAVGESHTGTLGPFTMSGGSDTILICADRDNEVLEKSKEYNNCLENILIHHQMPDLAITAKSETWVVEGSTYNITYTIKNIGSADAGESTTLIEIDGTEVANDTVPVLAPDESHTSMLGHFTISGNDDMIRVCADCENEVTEIDEDNNCRENTFEKPGGEACSDGTPCGDCSANKPKYCDNGVLVDNCLSCGCPEGQTCDVASGSCYESRDGACIADDGTVFTCGDTVTKSCTLNGSMSCPPGHGLIVGTDEIAIDGAGYMITGTATAANCKWAGESTPCTVSGIYNAGYDNVTLKNLEIEGFCTGIALAGTGANKVRNNTIDNCSIHDNGFNTTFNDLDMVTHGIHASYVRYLEITGNEIYNNEGTGDFCGAGGNGIFIYAGVSENYCDIRHNKLHDNAKAGFWTKMKLSKSTISYNEVWGNGNGAGIGDDVRGGIVLRCKKSDENLISYNDVHDHSAGGYGYGIYIGGRGNTIEHNTVTNNSKHGISMARSDGSFDNEMYNNLVCDNGVDISVTGGVTGNIGDENTCNTTYNYNDDGTTGCTYSCDMQALKGDLNGDGVITPADACAALQMAVSGEYSAEADVNDDDRVTSLDALLILQAADWR